ncbi:MAG: glycosyltransferase family 4 protein [Minisyncoccia bacterium]
MNKNLLIVTQKVDQNDPVLGFFHQWIFELAKFSDNVTVLCLEKGVYVFPKNVKVLSLGKERSVSRIKYIFNFYYFTWIERKKYDTVFVHMNQEYVLLGGILWRLLRKKIVMWRNHPNGNFFTDISVKFSHVVLCTSQYSYTAKFNKTISNMPVGIDTKNFFDKNKDRESGSILSIGRISPVKNILGIIRMISSLREKGWTGSAYVYGSAPTRDIHYEEEVRSVAAPLVENKVINFEPNVSYSKIADVYNAHEIYVNITPAGSLDKTIFEAMACGMMVITTNQALVGRIPDECICIEKNAEDLVEKVQKYLSLSQEKKREIVARLRIYVETEQSLVQLMNRLPNLLAKI